MIGLVPAEVTRKPPTPTHVDLSWPLVDYEQRRSRGQPLITFDAGFNPRFEKYAVRAFKPGDYVSSPLSRQDSVMQLSETAFVNWIVITCDKLPLWPIQLQQTTNLRVIDIFRAIYDTYAQPLTQEEFYHFGRETIGRCEAAFKQRCEDGPELACVAEKRGMLRIDLLRGRRIFKGLYPDRGKVGHYKLFFDDAPRRFWSFSYRLTPFDDFSRRLFFIYGRLILPILRGFTIFFFCKPLLNISHLQELKLYSASCLLLVVALFTFSSSVTFASFSSVYYACSFLFSSPLISLIYSYPNFSPFLTPSLNLPCRYVVIP